jgi:hypothetical protein
MRVSWIAVGGVLLTAIAVRGQEPERAQLPEGSVSSPAVSVDETTRVGRSPSASDCGFLSNGDPDKFGRYRIIRRLGQGGFGPVSRRSVSPTMDSASPGLTTDGQGLGDGGRGFCTTQNGIGL